MASWWRGWKPALVTALLGLAGGIWFILPPRGDLFFTRVYSWVQVFTYVGVASALVTLIGRARSHHQRTETAKLSLEEDLQLLDLGNGLVLDLEERITRWNTGSQRLYGYNPVTYVQPGTTPSVEVSAHRSEGTVQLVFADNGIGIPKELQQRIFDLFERGHSVVSEGRGVGLALVRKMTERMQGRIWVEAEVGQGSRFCLELQAAL